MEKPKSNGRILVVDDEYAIRVLLQNFLESNAYETRIAADGISAYEAFRQFSPDLLITDIMMPAEDGLSLALRIRVLRPDIPVIYLSAWLDEAETEHRLRKELDSPHSCRLILKPFNLDTLLRTIRDLHPPP